MKTMNKLKLFSLLILSLIVCKSFANIDYQPQTIILKIKPEFREFCKSNKIEIEDVQQFFSDIQVFEIKKIFPHHQPIAMKEGKKESNFVDLSLIYEIKFSSNKSLPKIIKQLSKLTSITYAEPKYNYALTYVPNDTDLALQFYHNNLQTFAAYNISQGDTNTVIGITDTGFDSSHVDLKNSFKINYADPINGTDDDADGFIDNYIGWDFGNNDNDPNPDPCAVCNHGVHVAGICSATSDNTAGIAGTGFKCKFMAIKIMNSAGLLVNGYEGIVYAADKNCKMVNCSWGGPSGGQFGQDAINYATINKNCLVIAAAGNNSSNQLFYPAAYDNVFSIAATDSDDVKWSNSNYGIFIDACAPGKDIYSTWPGNVYVPSSGTSMACPAAAGCAAIVASYFPNYNALQIAERLKNTCDNIDTVSGNNFYTAQLGHGRINLFKALTDAEKPALVTLSKNISDNNDNAISNGDTIRLKCRYKNYLAPTNNLIVKIRSSSPFVTILDSVANLGGVATLGDTSNYLQPFKIKVNPNCPQNQDVLFTLFFNDGIYNRKEIFYLRINVDYINLLENDLGITITSKGLIGYNQSNTTNGIGVTYLNSSSLLYEGGLMIGNSPNQVSDYVRGTSGNFDSDFFSTLNVSKIIPSVTADAELNGVFNDDGAAAQKLNVSVHQQTYAWSSTGNENFVILKYIINNKNSTTLNNIYAGIFADWDIMNYSKNRTRLKSNLNLSYAYSNESNSLYAGTKLLSNYPFIHYAIDLVNSGSGLVDLSDGYNTSEKFITLSNNRDSSGFTTLQGNDIAEVVSTGPITIFANDSAEVAFAIIAGNNEQKIIDGANAAQIKYNGIITDSFRYKGKNNLAVFPNPCNVCNFYISNFVKDKTSFEIYNLNGQLLDTRQIKAARENFNFSHLPNGIYIIKTNIDGNLYYDKIIIRNE